jgi:peptidoglycan/xylan/chitin deacetylase (PgdA/CDA1 family)
MLKAFPRGRSGSLFGFQLLDAGHHAYTSWRADRLVTLRAARPLGALAERFKSGLEAVPILQYRSISERPGSTEDPRNRCTTPRTFARQMARLRDRGHRVVSLCTAAKELAKGYPLIGSVVLTFDEGLEDFYSKAWPVLESLDFEASVFLSVQQLGSGTSGGPAYLQPHQIRRLADRGIHFGSATDTPSIHGKASLATLARDLAGSRQAIEDLTGRPVTTFSVYSRISREDAALCKRMSGLLSDCGYVAGVTAAVGRATRACNPCFLPRIPVDEADDQAFLDAKLDGHYDWLENARSVRDRLKSLLPGRRP